MGKPIKTCENKECEAEITKYKSDKRKYCSDSCKHRANFLKSKIKNRHHNEWLKTYKEQLLLLRIILKRGRNRIRLTTLEDLNFDLGLLQAPSSITSPAYRIGEYIIQKDKQDDNFCTIKNVIITKNS
jgi:hypothetical protein|tara:strand:- start:525 stop:908 length:384 start_codon:yes stop_codon:yes gene_type:complete